MHISSALAQSLLKVAMNLLSSLVTQCEMVEGEALIFHNSNIDCGTALYPRMPVQELNISLGLTNDQGTC